MKQRNLIVASALFAAGALALTACGGGSSSGNSGSNASSTAALTIYGTKPENPLIPANTNEVGGGNVLDAIFRGLVRYNPDTAAPELSMAESITSTDNLVWTVKLKSGQTFQDGSPVDANSFVNAWNWGAYGPNGEERWKRPLGPFTNTMGLSSSPILADGRLILLIDPVDPRHPGERRSAGAEEP